jgi:hypothetical protein
MTSARLVVAVVALLVGLWGPQQPPRSAIPRQAPNEWPGP